MNYLAELQKTLGSIDPTPLVPFVRGCQGTLWLAGNGGSASTAQHWACDLSKAAQRRVQALGCNSAVLTAYANDIGYLDAFAQELRRLARDDDRVIVLSCSGTSENIAEVLRMARRGLKLPCALVTGDLSVSELFPADVLVRVPHTHYGIIEDCHLAIGHWLTEELSSR